MTLHHTTRYQEPRPAPARAFLTATPLAARVADACISLDEDPVTRARIRNWTPGPAPLTPGQINRQNAEAMLREGHDPVAVADALFLKRAWVKRIARELGP